MSFWLQVIVNVVFSWIASAGFALTINVPHRALFLSGMSGVAGWMVYWFLDQLKLGRMVSNLAGAFLIGILGMLFARIKKCPAIVFNIPGLVPLVPGVPAYQAVRAMAEGEYAQAEDMILRVGIITTAIALGFLLSTLFIGLSYKARDFHRK